MSATDEAATRLRKGLKAGAFFSEVAVDLRAILDERDAILAQRNGFNAIYNSNQEQLDDAYQQLATAEKERDALRALHESASNAFAAAERRVQENWQTILALRARLEAAEKVVEYAVLCEGLAANGPGAAHSRDMMLEHARAYRDRFGGRDE